MPSSDARRYPRTRIALPVRVASVDPDRNPRTGAAHFRTFRAETVDISDGGLSLRALEDLGSGRRVLVEIELQGGQSIELAGRIVWLEPKKQPGLLSRMGVALAQKSLDLVARATTPSV